MDERNRVDLGEGFTPLLPLPRLGARLGLSRLYVKEEGRNPTGTFKARRPGSRGVAGQGAGDHGGRAADRRQRRRRGRRLRRPRRPKRCHVAMPADAPQAVMDEVRAYGADLMLVEGLIHDAGRLIAEGCKEHGWFDLATLKEPYRAEGKKTMGYELWEQFGGSLPELVLYPPAAAPAWSACGRPAAELEEMGFIDGRRPRLIAVQASGCAPIVRAFAEGAQSGRRRGRTPTPSPRESGCRGPSPTT